MQTGFLILFGLSCVLFPCDGRIISPAKGTEFTFLPGTTGNITWIFDDAISSLDFRRFVFTRRGSSTSERLATIVDNEDPNIRKSSLSGVEIVKPGTLLLKNVNQSYNGIYQFDLTASGPGISSDVTVFIAEKPIVKINCSRPMPIKLNEGDNFTCVCRGEGGNPPADVTWFKNGTQFGETRKENNTLTRTNVDESDNVTYTCLAQSYPDPMYQDSESVVVQVKFKPNGTTIEFTQNPAKLNTSVDIKCKSRGFPEPSYTITLNGTKTVSTDKTHTISMVWWNDTGTYNCTATNERGSDWAAKFLNVTEQGPTTTSAATTTASTTASSTPKKSSESTKTSTTKVPTTTSTPTPTPTTTPTPTRTSGTPIGLIIGIIIPVLALIVIVGVVVYCCKSKQKERSNSCANIDPVPGNSHELGEPGPGDGAYDTVWPVETSGSKSKPPVENALPPVYAAVDKNNREGNTLYASLDNEALKSSRASKKEPDRPQQTEYASIDFAKTGNAPKAV